MVDGKLIVADGGNNRVLIWNAVPSVIDTPADIVLGQSSMNSCAANDDDQDGFSDANPTARTLNSASDVWSDGERLVVADADNNRVLIWNSFPTTNFVPADVVLGQPDFVSDDDGTSASSFIYPYMLHSNGNQLFVADERNHRVLIWNAFPTEHGQPADVVLGQPDMDTDDANPGGGPSASGLSSPNGVHAAANQLVVGDYDNDRFLIFTGLNP